MNEKNVLLDLIRQEGVKGAVRSLAAAMREFADEMSDQGLKERALEAAEVSDILGDVDLAIEEVEEDEEDEIDE